MKIDQIKLKAVLEDLLKRMEEPGMAAIGVAIGTAGRWQIQLAVKDSHELPNARKFKCVTKA